MRKLSEWTHIHNTSKETTRLGLVFLHISVESSAHTVVAQMFWSWQHLGWKMVAGAMLCLKALNTLYCCYIDEKQATAIMPIQSLRDLINGPKFADQK